MVSRVKRYFLEIKDFSNTIDLNLPENYKIILDDKKCIKIWAFLHGLVGLNKIEQKLEGKEIIEYHDHNAISALRAAKRNFVSFITSAINGLIKG